MSSNNDLLWQYNCLDCVRTRECGETSLNNLKMMGLDKQDAFQQKMFWPVLHAMIRGVKVDKTRRAAFAMELMEEMSTREEWFKDILGHTLNPRSHPQMTKLFYTDLNQRPIYGKAKPGQPKGLTCDDEALHLLGLREPLLKPLLNKIAEYRSIGVFLSTFVMAPLDIDERARCSYNLCGTETLRLSSSENAFGSGSNMANIPQGGEEDDSELVLPNVRTIYVPDQGNTFFDLDLSKADLRIVVEESDETELRQMLAEGRDPYVEVAREFYHDPSLQKNRPDGSPHPRYTTFKSFCHGTHYLGTAVGLAQRLGLTVHEADKTQRWYLGKYPRIQKWQERVKEQVRSRRYVQNAYGFRRYYFDRVDDALFRQAIAWIPQSSIGLYINHIWLALFEQHPWIEILLQVHDSLAGQFPTYKKELALQTIKATAETCFVPYPKPLFIPIGIKTSAVSWGDCK